MNFRAVAILLLVAIFGTAILFVVFPVLKTIVTIVLIVVAVILFAIGAGRAFVWYLNLQDRWVESAKKKVELQQMRANLDYVPGTYGAVFVSADETRELTELKRPTARTIHHHYDAKGILPSPDARVVEAVPDGPIPVYAQEVEPFVSAGHICLGVMGGSDGKWSKFIWGEIADLISTAVVGIPGTGKSTLLRFVVAQTIKIGGQVIVWDPHGSIAREMSSLFPCYDGHEEIAASAAEMLAEIDRRRKLYKATDTVGSPILIVIDEWLLISDVPGANGKYIHRAVREIVLEGRKFGMFILLAGQSLPAASFKESGTAVSRAFVTRYVFNVNRMHAIQVGIPAEEAKRLLPVIEFAGPGICIISSGRLGVRPRIVAIPTTDTNDIRGALQIGANGSSQTPLLLTPRVGYLIENGRYVKDEDYAPVPPPLVDKEEIVPDLTQAPPPLPDNDPQAGFLTEEDKEKLLEWEMQGIARRYMPRMLGKGKRVYKEMVAFLNSQAGKRPDPEDDRLPEDEQ